jgi:pimeloyl-ACP methyl ester carboxylesterase
LRGPIIVIAALLLVALVGAGLWLWTPDLSRTRIETAYLDDPSDIMVVAGVGLHVRDTGPKDAPAIIMIHGFGFSLHTWEPWARALSDDYRVIRFDLPGSGLSGPDPTDTYNDARTLAVLGALMDRLGVDKSAMIGNSIGGRIAWAFAAAHPERVSKLVLVSPDGFASPGIEYGTTPEPGAMATLMRYVLPKPLLRMNLAAAYGDPSALRPETVDRYYDLLRAPGVRTAMIARMKQTVRQDPVPRLRTIEVPVLLVWGEKDALIPFANAADYAKALPDSTVVSFPALGHVPQEEAPETSLPPVRRFLDGA